MEILGSLIRLRPEYEERYIVLHRHTFPGVLDQIRRSNIVNYSIFLRESILFSYSEYVGADYVLDMKAMAADTTTQDWWKLTDPMQEPLQPSKPGEWWKKAELVFRLDEAAKLSGGGSRHAFVGRLTKDGGDLVRREYQKVDLSLISCFRRAHIQNYRAFLGGTDLYVYLEYSGDDFAGDVQKLTAEPAVRVWSDGLRGHLQGRWERMTEVFHQQ